MQVEAAHTHPVVIVFTRLMLLGLQSRRDRLEAEAGGKALNAGQEMPMTQREKALNAGQEMPMTQREKALNAGQEMPMTQREEAVHSDGDVKIGSAWRGTEAGA